jgi:hypothetical protein
MGLFVCVGTTTDVVVAGAVVVLVTGGTVDVVVTGGGGSVTVVVVAGVVTVEVVALVVVVATVVVVVGRQWSSFTPPCCPCSSQSCPLSGRGSGEHVCPELPCEQSPWPGGPPTGGTAFATSANGKTMVKAIMPPINSRFAA